MTLPDSNTLLLDFSLIQFFEFLKTKRRRFRLVFHKQVGELETEDIAVYEWRA
jgi:hypothetical protein